MKQKEYKVKIFITLMIFILFAFASCKTDECDGLLEISDGNINLLVGEKYTYTNVTQKCDEGTEVRSNDELTWSSSDTSIVELESKGTVVALKKGQSFIQVRTDTGKHNGAYVYVKDSSTTTTAGTSTSTSTGSTTNTGTTSTDYTGGLVFKGSCDTSAQTDAKCEEYYGDIDANSLNSLKTLCTAFASGTWSTIAKCSPATSKYADGYCKLDSSSTARFITFFALTGFSTSQAAQTECTNPSSGSSPGNWTSGLP